MAVAAPPTVPSLKQSFITAQANILSQPPTPSRTWRAANGRSDQPVPARVLDDALFALSQTIQQHCRRVYAPQASRNVAEQISNAYSRDTERSVGPEIDAEGGIGRELDLAEDEAIEALPPSWPSAREVDKYPMEARRYTEAVSRLARLSEQRKALRQRVEKLRHLKAVVDPLQTTDGTGAGVQENLVTREGPVERELERMRFLLARVAARVSALPDAAAAGSPDDERIHLDTLTGARKRAVDEFLADPRVFPSY